MIIRGDCTEELKKLPDNSVDAIVTDPPYGLEFMGKEWDSFKQKGQGDGWQVAGKPSLENFKGKNDWHSQPRPAFRGHSLEHWKNMQEYFRIWATEALRVLKPGAFLLAFGGTRTYHRLACGIEDAGFEIRDCIQWLYGSGFPKSLNIGKQIDKIQGNEREVVGEHTTHDIRNNGLMDRKGSMKVTDTKGNSEWEGWGTALKPANEPIVVARKPLSEKNVALNVLKWGTGGINIDACRVGTEVITNNVNDFSNQHGNKFGNGEPIKKLGESKVVGRFPANIILDEEAGKMLDEQTGNCGGGIRIDNQQKVGEKLGLFEGGWKETGKTRGHNDKGGASRFFYCAKASKSERNLGCDDFEEKNNDVHDNPNRMFQKEAGVEMDKSTRKPNKNNHPTVKPIKLMEYLIKLVSPEGATILDPFMGSGTTGIACVKLNRKFIGIEKEPEYIKIAEARIKAYEVQKKL